jgi:hypothetical protein
MLRFVTSFLSCKSTTEGTWNQVRRAAGETVQGSVAVQESSWFGNTGFSS